MVEYRDSTMGNLRAWSLGSNRLAILLLAVVVPPAVTLVWLGIQLLEQDRAVLAQREQQRRIAVGEAAAAELRRSIATAEHLFDGGIVPDGVVRFVFSEASLKVSPSTRLLWTAAPAALTPANDSAFPNATRLEYQGDLDGALRIYGRFANSSDRAVRAGALRRMARVQWQQRQWDDALGTYRALAELHEISDLGMPADLLARRNAADVLHAAGRADELNREVTQLETDLLASKWSLDGASWDLTIHDIARWRGGLFDVPPDRQRFSHLAETLWSEFREGTLSAQLPHRVVDVDGMPVMLLSRTSSDSVTIIGVSQPVLRSWEEQAVGSAFADEAKLALTTAAGGFIAGTPAPSGAPIVRLNSSDTGLPWTLTLHSDQWSRAGEQFEYRRRLLAVGLASILLLLGGGSYFLWRVVRRELAVSRLQADFVAAVSHEFRTPLASMRHVTELLEEDDEMPAQRRRSFYEIYRRNTERLHQLVESLLDFARMEAGRKAYELQPIDAAAFATRVVAEFQRHVGMGKSPIEVDGTTADGLKVNGDRDALANALWNLLDNAVKYSPEGQAIHVRVAPHPAGVAIVVEDRGLGIARHERDAIFQRFVRGQQALALGIKGTGLGLAMVAHIARAHGGDVEVESEEQRGSTFRLVLPAAPVTRSYETA